jgi:hypothetical protein
MNRLKRRVWRFNTDFVKLLFQTRGPEAVHLLQHLRMMAACTTKPTAFARVCKCRVEGGREWAVWTPNALHCGPCTANNIALDSCKWAVREAFNFEYIAYGRRAMLHSWQGGGSLSTASEEVPVWPALLHVERNAGGSKGLAKKR